MEGGAGAHILELRDTGLVAQQGFWRHDHKRLAEIAAQLAAQHMEVVGRRAAVHNLHIVLGAQLQVTLEACRAVLGSLALIAVRQQQHQRVHAEPFRLAGGDELVDHHLRAIGKIAELSFPHDQCVRLGLRETIFESHHRRFG